MESCSILSSICFLRYAASASIVTRISKYSLSPKCYQDRHGRRIVVSRVRSLTSETPCFVPSTSKKEPFRLFFLRRLPTSHRSVGMQMNIDYDGAGGSLLKKAKRKPIRLDGFSFGSPNRARTCDIMINSHALSEIVNVLRNDTPFKCSTEIISSSNTSFKCNRYTYCSR